MPNGQDQNVTYRVNIDDSNFQAKLTSMRASLDSAVGGGMSPGMAMGMMSAFQPGNFGGMNFGGNVGNSLAPVSFTPPAMAMNPHFGMFTVQQNLRQAGLASVGPVGMMFNNYIDNGFRGMMTHASHDPRVSTEEYMNYSAQTLGDQVQAKALSLGFGATNLGASLAGDAAGMMVGSAMFGGGTAGLIGGAIFGAAGGLGVGAIVGAVADKAADNVQMQQALASGSWRFYNGSQVDPITGRGMSRSARFEASSAVQNMAAEDFRFNATDYKQMLEGGMQMGMFEGTQDVEGFKSKMKELVSNVKLVTSTLHTTLKDSLEVMRSMRDMGVTSGGEINRLTMQSETLGRMSGRTGLEMMATGQQGAELFRGTGIAMERGFELAQNNQAVVRNLLNNGGISREVVAQMGGESGAAQMMTGSALQSFQTSAGRMGLMAAFNPATGQLDPSRMMGMASGGLMGSAARAANLGPSGIMSLQANQEELISGLSPEMMQDFGTMQMMGLAKNLRSAFPGLKEDDAMKYAGMQLGFKHEDIQMRMAKVKQDPKQFAAAHEQQASKMSMQAAMEDYEGHGLFASMGRGISAGFNSVAQPIVGVTGELADATARGANSLGHSLAGYEGIDPTLLRGGAIEAGGAAIENDLSTARANAQRQGRTLTKSEEDTIKYGTGVTDLTGPMFFGNRGAGEQAARLAGSSGLNVVTMSAEEAKNYKGPKMYSLGGSKYIGAGDYQDLMTKKGKLTVTEDMVSKAEKEMDPELSKKLAVALGERGGDMDMDSFLRGTLGKGYKQGMKLTDLSADQLAKGIAMAKGSGLSGIESMLRDPTGLGDTRDLSREESAALSSENEKTKESLQREIRGMVGESSKGTANSKVTNSLLSSKTGLEAVQMLARDPKSKEGLGKLFMAAKDLGLNQDQIKKIQQQFETTDDASRQHISSDLDAYIRQQRQLSSAADKASGGTGAGTFTGGAVSGGTTADAYKAFDQMQEQFKTQMQILNTLHEQYIAASKRR